MMEAITKKLPFLSFLVAATLAITATSDQVVKNSIDFSQAVPDPVTGELCVMQPVCIKDPIALSKLLPSEPCNLAEGCNCNTDSDCGGGTAKCVACKCKDCPVSATVSQRVLNPPITFVIDTTKSVKPDKDSIFNLTQKVVKKIRDSDINIPQYLLVTFNDLGSDINRNVNIFPVTQDILQFSLDIGDLIFESFDGGRDSKERVMQGLLVACMESPPNSLIVVFTDNGSKDLGLKNEILKIKEEKKLEIFLVLTPEFEGHRRDKSLDVYAEVAVVFNISEVGADVLLSQVQEFEKENCV